MSGVRIEEGEGGEITAAGCLLVSLSAAAMLAAAYSLSHWLGRVPRTVVIVGAAAAGALCFGIGQALLGLLAIPVRKGAAKGKHPESEI
jgi:hypothetical protein